MHAVDLQPLRNQGCTAGTSPLTRVRLRCCRKNEDFVAFPDWRSDVWLAGTDQNSDRAWYWATNGQNISIGYTDWRAEEPNNAMELSHNTRHMSSLADADEIVRVNLTTVTLLMEWMVRRRRRRRHRRWRRERKRREKRRCIEARSGAH
ncbi:hypothetical protein PoB_003909900 [Plakobranchus ocellatus]|uniref:C-type lectin domain-containing protein n=1 Tax=Plakobranchus ocellatus TaxID=259542 RepID=A0AAV4B1M7_9GAST|nr:hypothetical protein PoB_003909900 [Plakobranchus ocellatus]